MFSKLDEWTGDCSHPNLQNTMNLQLNQPIALCLLLLGVGHGHAAPAPAKISFTDQIKPLLSDRCFKCHGPDEKTREAGLRLDTAEGLFKALDNGVFVVKPGSVAGSELLRRITTRDPDDKMPPPKSRLSLTDAEVALLKRWVEQGAEWKKHWSFNPITDPAIPSGKDRQRSRGAIDDFVMAKLDREGLKPAPEAVREHLIRRLSFD
ncbi:MAG: hypothetical protein QOF48_1291, partial [Verrucomicrobiota bacterium]